MDIDKRILGFAGPTSSMHYVVRMEEKLVHAPHRLTVKPAEKPIARATETAAKAPSAASGDAASQSSTPRTATQPQSSGSSRNSQRR
jgi:hypothetical protein